MSFIQTIRRMLGFYAPDKQPISKADADALQQRPTLLSESLSEPTKEVCTLIVLMRRDLEERKDG